MCTKLKKILLLLVWNPFILVVSYMFNKHMASLPLSVFISISVAPLLFSKIKNYFEFDLHGNLSSELVIVFLLTGISILICGIILYYVITQIIYYLKKIFWDICGYYIKTFKNIFFPNSKNDLSVIENSNIVSYSLISYSQAIELIKQSAYGIQTKHKAVKNGVLKETGGKTVIKAPFVALIHKEHKEYIPSSEENLQSAKEVMLYDQIFQEFVVSFGYHDSSNQLKYEIIYNKTFIKIDNSKLEEFLRLKELELQQKLLTSNHEHIA